MGRPKYRSMGCEPDVIDGRPCDWPDCAASTNPSVSFLPAWLPIVVDDEEDQCVSSAWTCTAIGATSQSLRTATFVRAVASRPHPTSYSCSRRALVLTTASVWRRPATH